MILLWLGSEGREPDGTARAERQVSGNPECLVAFTRDSLLVYLMLYGY